MVSDSTPPAPGGSRGPVRKARRIPRDPGPCFAQLPEGKQGGEEWPPARGPPGALALASSQCRGSAVGEEREGLPQRPLLWDHAGLHFSAPLWHRAALHSHPASAALPWSAPVPMPAPLLPPLGPAPRSVGPLEAGAWRGGVLAALGAAWAQCLCGSVSPFRGHRGAGAGPCRPSHRPRPRDYEHSTVAGRRGGALAWLLRRRRV